MRITTIIHERLGRWARQLRPRLAGRPVRLVETRSVEDLESAAAKSICPLILIAVEARHRASLEALDRARRAAPGGMILVLDAPALLEFARLARELGATHVLPSPVLPPQVLSWLERWTPMAATRAESSGWSEDRRADPEPWEEFLDLHPAPARP